MASGFARLTRALVALLFLFDMDWFHDVWVLRVETSCLLMFCTRCTSIGLGGGGVSGFGSPDC